MHTVELLEQAIAWAKHLGYSVRQEWIGDGAGGGCEFGGRKWIFLDLALPTPEQFEQILDVLRQDPAACASGAPVELARWLGVRKSA